MAKIFDNINSYIMEAMKAKEPARANAYKNLKAKMLEFKTAKNAKPLDDTAEITIINKMIKELHNDADIFEKNGRKDLAIPALTEAQYLGRFVPQPARLDEVRDMIEKYIVENGQFTQKEMGLVIKYIKSQFENVDGAMVATEVKNYLNYE